MFFVTISFDDMLYKTIYERIFQKPSIIIHIITKFLNYVAGISIKDCLA
jgi:hypothetical protein